jgi:hypothetical protein
MSCPHRRIYEKNYGPIPIDANGRTYDIHHLDGNHSNNDPLNLVAVTLEEHYAIHESQGDVRACLIMAQRMGKSPEEIKRLAKQAHDKRVEAGTANLVGGKIQSASNQQRLANGTHHLLKRPDGSSVSSDCVKAGKNNFLRRPDGTSQSKDTQQRQLQEGTHMNQRRWKCVDCGKEGIGVSNEVQHHRKYCKHKTL